MFNLLFFENELDCDIIEYPIFLIFLNLSTSSNYVYVVYDKENVIKGIFNTKILADNFINKNNELFLKQVELNIELKKEFLINP